MTITVSEDSILDRWAHLVVEVVEAEADLATLAAWAHRVHVSVGTLRQVCRAVGVTGKRSLDLARVLRAVAKLEGDPWMPEAVLSCRDPRTLRALLVRTGCTDCGGPLTLDSLLTRQTVLPQDGAHLLALRRVLAENSSRNSGALCVDVPRSPG